MRCAVAVVARAPSAPGKSRLTAELGTADGESLRRALLRDTLDVVSALDAEKAVLYTPPECEAEMRALTPFPALFVAQEGETLGDRMGNGARQLLSCGFEAVILIGSDLPTLPASHLRAALGTLRQRRNALVLGPADDGGYYLMGLQGVPPQLFDRIPWGTPGVLERTLEAAAALGMAVEMLPRWFDVDSVRDLRRVLDAQPDAAGGAARHTRAWVEAALPDVRERLDGGRMREWLT